MELLRLLITVAIDSRLWPKWLLLRDTDGVMDEKGVMPPTLCAEVLRARSAVCKESCAGCGEKRSIARRLRLWLDA